MTPKKLVFLTRTVLYTYVPCSVKMMFLSHTSTIKLANLKFVRNKVRGMNIVKYKIICLPATYTSSSAIAERPRDARVTSIRKIAKWNF